MQGKKSTATLKARPSKSPKRRSAAASHADHKIHSRATVVVEAGSRSKSSLRHLEEGSGPLIHEVDQIVQAIHAAVPEPVPVVIVYREKRSAGYRLDSPLGMSL